MFKITKQLTNYTYFYLYVSVLLKKSFQIKNLYVSKLNQPGLHKYIISYNDYTNFRFLLKKNINLKKHKTLKRNYMQKTINKNIKLCL